MKKLSICVLLLFSFGAIAAQNRSVDLSIFSEQGERFWVVVNGIRQNEKATPNVKVTNLQGMGWKVKIIFENEALTDIDKAIYAPLEGITGLVYQIKKHKKKGYILRGFSYEGQSISVPDISKILEIPYHDTDIFSPNRRIEPENYPSNTARNPCLTMDEQTFRQGKSSIAGQGFEETKIKEAKQIAQNFCHNSAQIREILQLFDFEQSRLDFAKWAYNYTSDPQNYFKVNDVFNFSTSVDELLEYIERNRRN
jgi:hypothetical protein